MRILILIHEFPPIGGGGGRVAQDVARILVRRGHKVHVIAPHMKGLSFQSHVEGVFVTRLPSFRTKPYSANLLAMGGYLFVGLLTGLWKIWLFRPDLIHVHFAVPAGALAWILHRLTGVPYVLTTHLGDVPGGVPEKTDIWFRWIYPFTPRIWRNAACVTAISEYTRQLALIHYPVDIRVIPNGIDLNSINGAGTIRVNNPPRIVFAGRFVLQKNLFSLVKVLNEVKDMNWDCVMIGNGPLFAKVKEEIELVGLGHRVKFTGWLASDQVLDQLARADILLLPSLSEGISVAALQSLACGLAIVASRVGGLTEIVLQGENGFLHEPTDIHGFGNSLRTLLMDGDVLYKVRLASLKMSERFDLAKIVDDYEETFMDAINRK